MLPSPAAPQLGLDPVDASRLWPSGVVGSSEMLKVRGRLEAQEHRQPEWPHLYE